MRSDRISIGTRSRRAVVAAVCGIALAGSGRSGAMADDARYGAAATGPWSTRPVASSVTGNSWDAPASQMIPMPNWSACDACDFSDLPVYGVRHQPYLGERIRNWWSEHIRSSRRNCYYRHQDFHTKFFNPVFQPSGPPYGYHAKAWTPFPECFPPPPPPAHSGYNPVY